MSNLTQFYKGYLEAAIFADLPEEHIGELSTDNIERDSRVQALQDCKAFLAQATPILEATDHKPGSANDTKYNHAGRDFWYTRNGHGCGFWDGDWFDAGDQLDKIAQTFPTMYLGVNIFGLVYIERG